MLSDPIAADFLPIARLADGGLITHLFLIVCDQTLKSLQPDGSEPLRETTSGSSDFGTHDRIGSVGFEFSAPMNGNPRVRDLCLG